MKSRFAVILVTLLAVTAVTVAMSHAGRIGGRGPGQGRGHGGLFGQLTEEQRDALHAMVQEMRDVGAAREEIHTAVREMLAGWGIDLPEHPGSRGEKCGGERAHHPPFLDQLTEEQRDTLHAMVEEMKEAGASHDDIRAAVHEKLEGWGIELPERPREPRGHRREVFKQLTEEQRTAVREMIREMRDAGASREEVHAAVREMLEGFGVELPEGASAAPSPEVLESENAKSATWGEIKGSFK